MTELIDIVRLGASEGIPALNKYLSDLIEKTSFLNFVDTNFSLLKDANEDVTIIVNKYNQLYEEYNELISSRLNLGVPHPAKDEAIFREMIKLALEFEQIVVLELSDRTLFNIKWFYDSMGGGFE